MSRTVGGPAPQSREDPFGRFVTWIAPARAGRPNEFRAAMSAPPATTLQPASCPLCEGNEQETTPEVAALRPAGGPANGPGWSARIVTNLFPATIPASGGRHEVLVETPRHAARFAEFPVEDLASAFELVQLRTRALVSEGFANVTLFRNSGARAGASLSHPHSQLIALARMPPLLAIEHAAGDRCRACDAIASERAAQLRVIDERDGFVCYAPFAARFHCEMVVAPIAHPTAFVDLDRATLVALAKHLQGAVRRLDAVLDSPPFNLVLQCAVAARSPHWRVEILPRVTGLGGFELGAGAFINSMPPEDAAARLRAAGR